LTVGKIPLERVHKLLATLDSIMVSKDRGSLVSKAAEALLNKVHSTGRVNLQKPEPEKER